MTKVFTDDMVSISGLGDGSDAGKHHSGWDETTCRAMVLAGLDWMERHPDAAPLYAEHPGIKGIFLPLNQSASELLQYMIGTAAAERIPSDIFHAVVGHTIYAYHLGWEEYVRQSRGAHAKQIPR